MKFFRRLAEEIGGGNAVVVATVVEAKGSVPREIGAKMIVCPDGRIFETIGGGAGEAKVIQAAGEVFKSRARSLVEVDLTGVEERQTEGICGGIMRISLELWQGAASLSLAEVILSQLESGKSIRLATPINYQGAPFLLPDKQAIPAGVFVEILQPLPTLLIVGAGHVAIELAKIAEICGFEIAVQDDRSDWANTKNYPKAAKIFTQTIAETVAHFADNENFYAALLTRAYKYDLEALKELLKGKPVCRYIGMIGSEKRVRKVVRAIEESGIEKERLASLHAPIGLDIGALTPAEIAVSIAAELIKIRRGGTGQSLSIYCK